ncbi:chorismate synthase [Bacteriovorax sp. BSW11_IV]|uniref:chorismate synthase n=1 Tax=Bacteriovorax sp. BSW11_IV TaxID=1353529 RepID=UPI00038A11CF|nr:chorismate synthase [Bacteriovorax sp. BSW11_IV]EQC48308.1 chorismate synthase [Bacteriovorax sp. BSW11_IV]
MRGNTFGKMFSFTTFGESHGKALGVVIDGMPAGIKISEEDLQKELDRRAPGKLAGTTARTEADKAVILSGIFENTTMGTPIAVMIENTNQRSGDYDKLKDNYRPGHADKTYIQKYGVRDHRGGGRSSGRETVSRVIAGYFASLILKDIKVKTIITKMGPFDARNEELSVETQLNRYNFPATVSNKEMEDFLTDLKVRGESVGGRVCTLIEGCPAGLGEPAFDKLKAELAHAVMSIGACVSFSFGLGEDMENLMGSVVSSDAKNFGGIEGGISNGETILLQSVFKPTSTVGEKAKEGRHDPCILPRAVPVVEAMVKVTIADHLLRQNAYQL